MTQTGHLCQGLGYCIGADSRGVMWVIDRAMRPLVVNSNHPSVKRCTDLCLTVDQKPFSTGVPYNTHPHHPDGYMG